VTYQFSVNGELITMPTVQVTKNDFLKNELVKFGIKDDISKLKSLVVPAGETHMISSRDPKQRGVKWLSDVGYKLQPKSIVQMKKWIGIPDEIARQRVRPQVGPSRMVSPDLLESDRASRHEVMGAAIATGRDYITGDSSKISQAQVQAIDSVLHITDHIHIFPVFMDVTIDHNATLVLGPDINSFHCGNLVIKTGGKMTCKSTYTAISAYSVKGKQP
jgi:hypothetical protein